MVAERDTAVGELASSRRVVDSLRVELKKSMRAAAAGAASWGQEHAICTVTWAGIAGWGRGLPPAHLPPDTNTTMDPGDRVAIDSVGCVHSYTTVIPANGMSRDS